METQVTAHRICYRSQDTTRGALCRSKPVQAQRLWQGFSPRVNHQHSTSAAWIHPSKREGFLQLQCRVPLSKHKHRPANSSQHWSDFLQIKITGFLEFVSGEIKFLLENEFTPWDLPQAEIILHYPSQRVKEKQMRTKPVFFSPLQDVLNWHLKPIFIYFVHSRRTHTASGRNHL